MMQYVVFSDVPYKLSPQVAAINNCKLATLAEIEVIRKVIFKKFIQLCSLTDIIILLTWANYVTGFIVLLINKYPNLSNQGQCLTLCCFHLSPLMSVPYSSCGSRGGGPGFPPLIFSPNCGPKGRKFFLRSRPSLV